MLKEQALTLYKAAFPEDPEDFAADFINRFFDKDCRYIIRDEKLVSMLFLLDAKMVFGGEKISGKYLYAAATLPEYRGKGLMAELIEKSKAETVEKGKFLLTKPAKPSLFDYYGKFGFKTVVFSEDKLIKKQTEASPLKVITAEEYRIKREELLKECAYITLCDNDYVLSSFTLFADENTLAAVDTSETPPVVKEFITKDENAKNALMSTLNCEKAVVRKEGKTPFAMLIMPKGEHEPKNLNFALALD